MNKIKIERAAKLEVEDKRNRNFNVLSGATIDKKVWMNAMGDQLKLGYVAEWEDTPGTVLILFLTKIYFK